MVVHPVFRWKHLLVRPILFTRMQADDTSTEPPCCKVGRVLREYALDGLDDELERRWGGRGSGSSLRELQREVNRRLVHSALIDVGLSPVEGEAANLQRLLTSSDVSESRRIEARRRLESDGVDVDSLVSDFVSHQTIYNHLRDCRDVSRADEQSDQERLARAESTIFGLQNRTELVTEQTLSQLASNEVIHPEEYDVVVDIQAICKTCGRSYEVETLLESNGCQCE